ncbi:uncharacterized protein H6S33_006914 [Morchella sextelata]|jgi:hypothetical protein|uniref:uncharacterized protein n=1 Tax=Morchella sextelata TaxID=1174677 RepID=UPI001D04CD8B|nr:uncharacterized protein H6S33_006914 [Morchella sextelata]KAH0604537.1 hypothetical protein H6S33_006914 [Morchella sextelata]
MAVPLKLLSLPSEILVLIFDFIPHPCFSETNPSILYVSKAWYTYAHAAWLQHLRLTSNSLPRFPPDDVAISDFIQDHTTSLKLKLYGVIDYTTPIKARLEEFASAVGRMRKLRNFAFMACYCSAPWEHLPGAGRIEDEDREDQFPLNYLWVESIYTLMLDLPKTVTTLKLDTIGSALMTGHEGQRIGIKPKRGQHICGMFRHMTALRFLKVRMDLVCGDVFEGPHLRRIIVNLRRKDKDGNKMLRMCRECEEAEELALESEEVFYERLYNAGKEAVLAVEAGTKECFILGERIEGDLYEINCGTALMKIYANKPGRAWCIKSGKYKRASWRDLNP